MDQAQIKNYGQSASRLQIPGLTPGSREYVLMSFLVQQRLLMLSFPGSSSGIHFLCEEWGTLKKQFSWPQLTADGFACTLGQRVQENRDPQ